MTLIYPGKQDLGDLQGSRQKATQQKNDANDNDDDNSVLNFDELYKEETLSCLKGYLKFLFEHKTLGLGFYSTLYVKYSSRVWIRLTVYTTTISYSQQHR